MPQPRVDAAPLADRRKVKAGMKAAAVGFAVLDAASSQGRAHAIEGIRLPELSQPRPDADAYQTARGLLAAGDVPGAISAFRRALLQSPQSIDALNGLGVSYDRMGRYDLSQTYYESALAIDPNSALVLNNLGYSLFLQHDFKAAIPILQRVAGTTNSAARANAQRLLTLVAAEIRNNAAAASTALAMREIEPSAGEIRLANGNASPGAAPMPRARAIDVASTVEAATPNARGRNGRAGEDRVAAVSLAPGVSIAAPRARIEQSSNGEQRLVLGGPEPDRALAASLGDDAVLVLVAPAWTARDERALAMAEVARDRMEARAAAAAADLAAANAAGVTPVVTASLASPSAAARLAAEFPTNAIASPVAVAFPATTPALETAAVVAPTPARPKRRREAPIHDEAQTIQALVETNARPAPVLGDATPPVWLLAGQRLDRPIKLRRTIDRVPRTDDAIPAFESDDGELNAFAARMRGIAPEPARVSDIEAVARLEALLTRLRAA